MQWSMSFRRGRLWSKWNDRSNRFIYLKSVPCTSNHSFTDPLKDRPVSRRAHRSNVLPTRFISSVVKIHSPLSVRSRDVNRPSSFCRFFISHVSRLSAKEQPWNWRLPCTGPHGCKFLMVLWVYDHSPVFHILARHQFFIWASPNCWFDICKDMIRDPQPVQSDWCLYGPQQHQAMKVGMYHN